MKRVQKQAFLSVILLIVLAVFVVVSINVNLRQALEKDACDKGLIIAEYIAEGITLPLLNEDVLQVQEIINSSKLRNKDIKYIYVVGFDGKLFAHTFSGGFPVDFIAANPMSSEENNAIKVLSINGESVQDIGIRVLEAADAKVYVGFSQEPLHESLRSMTNAVLVAVILVILLSIAASFLLQEEL